MLDPRSETLVKLIEEYKKRPFAERHKDASLESELDELSVDMINNPPVGKAKGLRLGDKDFLKVPKFKESRLKVIPIDEWDKYVESEDFVDLERFVWTIFDQDNVGSCAAESLTQGLQLVREYNNQERVELNPWFMYHTTSGGVDRGSTLQDNLQFAMKVGVAPTIVWPRDEGWRKEPSEEAKQEAKKYRLTEFYEVENWEEFGSALLQGCPVYFGYDSHAVLATQLLSKTMAEFVNSWSADWGRNGFGVINSDRILFGFGAYAICSTVVSE